MNEVSVELLVTKTIERIQEVAQRILPILSEINNSDIEEDKSK